jgi:hypothetical protein
LDLVHARRPRLILFDLAANSKSNCLELAIRRLGIVL